MSDKLRAVLVGDTLTYNLTPEQAIAVGINPAIYVGESGKSPYIGEDNYWYEFDDETREWINTGVYADEKAAEAALAAAERAEQQASAAEAAAGRVDTAIEAAQTAAQAADTAAGAANDAADAATQAADDAKVRTDEAVSAAEAATEKASAAAGTANQSATDADTAAQKALDAAKLAEQAASGVGLRKEVLDHIPEPSEMVENVIYLVPAAEPNPENTHEEYMLIDGQRELIGSTAVDLTGYAKKDELAEVATSGSYADLTGTDGVATKGYVGEQIDAVEIGGTNIIRGTNDIEWNSISGDDAWSKEQWSWAVGDPVRCTREIVAITDSPNPNIHTGFHGTIPDGLSTWNGISQRFVPMIKGHTYTLSCYARCLTGSASIQIQVDIKLLGDDAETHYSNVTPITNNWERYSFTFIIPENAGGYVNKCGNAFMGCRTSGLTTIEICGMKTEVGNKATDWSPAPEDVVAQIEAVDAKIDGIEIGGRNLLLNSKIIDGYTGKEIDEDGFTIGYVTSDGTKWMEKRFPLSLSAKNNQLVGKQVTISLDFKTNNIQWINEFYFNLSINNKYENRVIDSVGFGRVSEYTPIYGTTIANDKWVRIKWTWNVPDSFTTPEDIEEPRYGLQIKLNGESNAKGMPAGITMWYRKIKVEIGNKATDWSPSPDDVDAKINAINIGVARADYIAMMSGIEIPDDAETAAEPGAQADPNGMESPGIDDEPVVSEHYDTVARYYRCDCWSAAMVRNAVGRWITADEADEIINGNTAD